MEIGILLIGGLVIFLLWKIDDMRSKNKEHAKPNGDKFLSALEESPDSYQHFFEQIEKVADGKIWGRYISDSEFAFSEEGMSKMEKEEKKTDPIFKEATAKGLNQVVLLVVYLQYLMADPLFDHDTKKPYWVSVVRNRKSVDSFPSHNALAHLLEQYGYISEN
jgi:hypothetical protein